MELVYPIYLDTPMMTAFLASLEGGILEDTTVESKLADSQENARTGSLGAKVSNLLSNFVDAEAKGELAKKVSESLEAHYKSTLRFPNAALFIRLRELLLEQKVVEVITSDQQLADVSVGDLVEFRGLVVPNPSYQIRRAFNQMLPLLESLSKLQVSELEQTLASLDNSKVDQTIKIRGETLIPRNNQEIKVAKNRIAAAQDHLRSESSMYQTMDTLLTGLFPGDSMDTLLFRSTRFQAICRVYPALAREERIQDIYDANWHCLGKVVGIIQRGEKHDLLQGSPISYLKDQFPLLASSLNNEHINIQTTEPIVAGPALIVATLAIFA